MSKTYKERNSELMQEFNKLNSLNAQLRNNIDELQKILSGEVDIRPYKEIQEKLETYEYALATIRACCNPATQAWDFANSVLSKYE